MNRVVVTGMGAVSCLGIGRRIFFDALLAGRSGIGKVAAFSELGMTCCTGAAVDATSLPELPRKLRRFLSTPATYAWHAMREAIDEAKLEPSTLSSRRCGVVMGGNAALSEHEAALAQYHARGIGRLSPFIVPRCMTSALPASLAHAFGIGGRSTLVSAACASAAHAIGQAMELLQAGRQDVVVCGGAEELDPKSAMGFDTMGALSVTGISRPWDTRRDGFVLGEGAGVLVLETLDHARARGAVILAEVTGYGAATDPHDMVAPDVDGIVEAMHQAIEQAGAFPGYINAHACSTEQGDTMEWKAIERVAARHGSVVPPVSSIKAAIGHAPGASGAFDAIASIAMLDAQVVVGAAVDMPDAIFANTPIVFAKRALAFDQVLSNSFGFGGSCASLMFARAAA